MGGKFSISEVTATLWDTYRAFDLRVAALRDGETWANGITVVRLTHEDVHSVQASFHDLERRYTAVATDNLKILLSACPLSEWEEFCRECKAGRLRVGDLEIRLAGPILVTELAGEIRPYAGDLRPTDGNSWPGLFATVGGHDRRLGQEPLIKEVGPLGYSDPYEAINELCQVNVRNGQNTGQGFYLSAPVFGRFESVRLINGKKQLDVTVRKHAHIRDLSASVVLRGQTYGTGECSMYRKLLPELKSIDQGGLIQTLGATAPDLPEVASDDWVEVKLLHPKLGEIEQFMRRAFTLVPPTERNVLFEALKRFCPEAKLQQLLGSPHSVESAKLKKKSADAAFELHAAWLLGLCGFCTIVLGDYEHLVAPKTNVRRGSIDIIASRPHGDTLFLVACTLGRPSEDDFANLLNMQATLKREVFHEASIQVIPVMFTGARGQPECKELENGFNAIPIIDADRIEIVLALVREGREAEFLNFLASPGIVSLRRLELR